MNTANMRRGPSRAVGPNEPLETTWKKYNNLILIIYVELNV